jgi:hypothetical protein
VALGTWRIPDGPPTRRFRPWHGGCHTPTKLHADATQPSRLAHALLGSLDAPGTSTELLRPRQSLPASSSLRRQALLSPRSLGHFRRGFWRNRGLRRETERSLLADASTPAYRTVCRRGAGTDAARRLRRERGSRSNATVPSEKGFLSVIRTSPSGPRVMRSCATEGRNMYFRSASRPATSCPPARVAAWRVTRFAIPEGGKPSRATHSGRSNTIGRRSKGSAPRRHSGPAGDVVPATADAASTASPSPSPSASPSSRRRPRRRRYFTSRSRVRSCTAATSRVDRCPTPET